jgi:chemotaxis protein MotA
MELFALLFELFSVMRKSGEMALEKDVDDPTNSEIFKKYPKFMSNTRREPCFSTRFAW